MDKDAPHGKLIYKFTTVLGYLPGPSSGLMSELIIKSGHKVYFTCDVRAKVRSPIVISAPVQKKTTTEPREPNRAESEINNCTTSTFY